MTEEQAHRINLILHRMARVIGNLEKRKQQYIDAEQIDVQELALARAELLGLVDMINGGGNGKNTEEG